jgi:hypothetical protein
MKKIIAYSSALLILFAGCALAAQKATTTKAPAKPSMCANYDKLTKDQKADVNTMISDAMNKMNPNRQELMSNFEMLQTLMMQIPLDERAINKTAKKISDLRTDLFMMHVDTVTQIDKKYGYIPVCCLTQNHCAKVMKMQEMMLQNEMQGMKK